VKNLIAAERRTPLKKQLWTLIVLNFLDGLLTYFGLVFDFIAEGNPLLSTFSPFSILLTKFFLSLCLFALLFTPFVYIQSRKWRSFLIFTNGLYSVVLLLHLCWFILLIAY
jgi:hypothetical protein